MANTETLNIDQETIRKIGLRPSTKVINAQIAPDARVFDYPELENVFVMESDLYGNRMPKDSCFLAFNGQHGLVGKHLAVDVLKNSSRDEIRHIAENNQEG